MSDRTPHGKPARTLTTPRDVLEAEDLTADRKIEILRQWAYDAREKEVAEEENMGGTDPDLLPEILGALASLESKPHSFPGTTGKQGGS